MKAPELATHIGSSVTNLTREYRVGVDDLDDNLVALVFHDACNAALKVQPKTVAKHSSLVVKTPKSAGGHRVIELIRQSERAKLSLQHALGAANTRAKAASSSDFSTRVGVSIVLQRWVDIPLHAVFRAFVGLKGQLTAVSQRRGQLFHPELNWYKAAKVWVSMELGGVPRTTVFCCCLFWSVCFVICSFSI